MSEQEQKWLDARHLIMTRETELQADELSNDVAQCALAEINLINACYTLIPVYTLLQVERQLERVKGIQGATGIQGTPGVPGNQGDKGIQGPVGPTGPKGDRGNTGIQGIQGLMGPQGPVGPTGQTGPKGDRGNTGIQGPAGTQGTQGIQGTTGAQGTQGTTNTQGTTGIQVGETIEVVSSVTTSWVRGKTYQLAPGSYDNLIFKTPDAGTSKIEVRGGPSVKVRKVTITGNYLNLVNLEVYDAVSPITTRAWMVDVAAGMHDLLLDRVQIHRPDRTYYGRGIYATRGGNHHITLKNCWIHNLWGPYYYGIGDSDLTIDGGVFENNSSNAIEHSEGIDLNGTINLIVKNATFKNTEGTSYLVALHHGGTNWKIFNNVFCMDSGSAFGVGHGTIADNTTADAPAKDIQIYHNTFVLLGSAGGRSGVTFWVPDNVLVRNNLFYKCTKLSMLGANHDYSATYDCPVSPEYTKAAHDVAGTGDPFADTSFRLNNTNKHIGQALAAEFGVDRDGKPRTNWTRGAYE